MLSKDFKDSNINTSQYILNNLNEYIVKIDYFDQKGTKNFEDNIPLKYIFDSKMKLPLNKL